MEIFSILLNFRRDGKGVERNFIELSDFYIKITVIKYFIYTY